MEDNKKFTVIRDSREKDRKGWHWPTSEYCAGTETRKLDSGDYSLLGFESQVAIERKFGAAELAKNIFETRFPNCLERLSKIPYSFIIVECNFQDIIDYPYIKSIPTNTIKSIKVSGKLLLKKLCEFQIQFGTNIIYAGNSFNGWEIANSIFKRVYDKNRTTK